MDAPIKKQIALSYSRLQVVIYKACHKVDCNLPQDCQLASLAHKHMRVPHSDAHVCSGNGNGSAVASFCVYLRVRRNVFVCVCVFERVCSCAWMWVSCISVSADFREQFMRVSIRLYVCMLSPLCESALVCLCVCALTDAKVCSCK